MSYFHLTMKITTQKPLSIKKRNSASPRPLNNMVHLSGACKGHKISQQCFLLVNSDNAFLKLCSYTSFIFLSGCLKYQAEEWKRSILTIKSWHHSKTKTISKWTLLAGLCRHLCYVPSVIQALVNITMSHLWRLLFLERTVICLDFSSFYKIR